MKNLLTLIFCGAILVAGGLACKNNPFAKFTKQYHCSVPNESEPKTSEDYVSRGLKHLELDNYAAGYDECAFNAFSEAIRLDPNNAEAYAMRGFQHYSLFKREQPVLSTAEKQEHWEAAEKDLSAAISLNPNKSSYFNIRSLIYEARAFDDKVINDLTKSLELEETARNYARRGDFYGYKKDYENAVKDFTEAIRLSPDEIDYYSKREEAYKSLGKNDLAEADHLKIMNLKYKDERQMPDSKNTQNSNSNKNIPKTISGGVLNGKATNLVNPVYPAAAKAVRASGAVNVQVTIDEQGNVISATAVSGHPLLRASAVQAARESKFSPTLLSGQAVKVTGVIVYNFTTE